MTASENPRLFFAFKGGENKIFFVFFTIEISLLYMV